MKINVHAHVFNFQSILTAEMLVVLKNRLSGIDMPESLRNMLLNYLRDRLNNRKKISVEDFENRLGGGSLLGRLLRPVRRLLKGRVNLPSDSEAASLLLKLIEAGIIERTSVSTSTVGSSIDWIRIGLIPGIDNITDDLMSHHDEDDIVVLLPMDIIDRKNDPKELEIYPEQLEATIKQALRYPGRVLPFVMVNTIRNDSRKIFFDSVKNGSCVGVKLYPSLGYTINSPAMMEILRYCNDHDLPVLMHCNDRGFSRGVRQAQMADPSLWDPVLSDLKKLKICFAHFGGDQQNGKENWGTHPLPTDTWPSRILEMMRLFPGRVYADISFHVTFLERPATKNNYRKNLKEIIADPACGSQVLWGTDYHLLRQKLTDTNFADEYRNILGDGDFRKISVDNPADFLGLPVNGKPEGENIRLHIQWLEENRVRPEFGKTAGWLVQKIPGTGT